MARQMMDPSRRPSRHSHDTGSSGAIDTTAKDIFAKRHISDLKASIKAGQSKDQAGDTLKRAADLAGDSAAAMKEAMGAMGSIDFGFLLI